MGGTVSKDELQGWLKEANKQIPIVRYNQYKGVTIPKSNLPDFSISMGKYNFEGEILYKPLKDLLFSIFMFFWKRSYRNKEALHGSFSFTEDK